MSRMKTAVWRSGALLAVIAVGGVALLSGVHLLTRERIAEQERRVMQQRLAQVLAPDSYDNDPHRDMILVHDPAAFGHQDPVRVFRARRDGRPVAVIMELTAPDGYNGAIRMLVGIFANGEISGVRVIAHRETPGLGDPIEARRSDWIDSFRGRSMDNPEPSAWAVRKDGGVFDQFTGATITPRAVVRAVRRALEYHDRHRESLYARPAEPEPGAS